MEKYTLYRLILHPSFFTFLSTLFIYLVTLAPGVTWAHWGADGGDLMTAATTLGVPHPSGYPTYVLVGKLFSYMPLGTVAYRFNLLSAVSIASACAIVSNIFYNRGTKNFWGSVAGGLMVGFAPLIWSQAVITEVYGLNLLVVAGVVWAIVEKRPRLAGLLWGLSVTTHLTSVFLLPLLLWRMRGMWKWIVPYATIGILPMFMLFGFARTGSPVNWFDPADFAGWWSVISGEIYRPLPFSHPILERLPRVILPTLQQFGYVGWLLLWPYGVNVPPRNQSWHFGGTAALYAIYALGYDTPDAAVFTLPAILLLVVMMRRTILAVGRWVLILPVMMLILNFSAVNLHEDTAAHDTFWAVAPQIPESAVVFTPGDNSIFTLWYYHYVEGHRPDIIPVDDSLFQFEWYRETLAEHRPDLVALAEDDVPRFRAENGALRPFCTVSLPNGTIECD